ncbi:MAG: permease-like cell division protein FtsX [Magnetococcus sp. WYHC-3]
MSAPPRRASPPAKGYGLHRRSLARAWRPLREGSLSHWTSVVIIALALGIFGIFSLLADNANRGIQAWSGDNRVLVFLKETAGATEAEAVAAFLTRNASISEVTIIPPATAAERTRRLLGPQGDLLDALPENPFPYSLEFTILGTAASSEPTLAALAQHDAVAQVDFDRQWAQKLVALLESLRFVTHALSALLLLAVALIIANTVKLTILGRREEVEVMRFLGASATFIRTPYLYEGMIQGLLGALAGMALVGVFFLGARSATGALAQMVGLDTLLAPPAAVTLLLLPLSGMLVGLAGALLAIVRFMRH